MTSAGLNPFFFRAGFEEVILRLLSRLTVLIPSSSGQGSKYRRSRTTPLFEVLIPSSSGQGSKRGTTGSLRLGMRLNPFFFRAGFEVRMGAPYAHSSCLNPFFFRAGFEADSPTLLRPPMAVLIPSSSGQGSKLGASPQYVPSGRVLIPSSSGQGSKRAFTTGPSRRRVLIPSSSGQGSKLGRLTTQFL